MPILSRALEAGVYQIRQSLNFSRGPMRRIFASGGGHGSVFLTDALKLTFCKIHIRPDTAFDVERSLDNHPSEEEIRKFKGMTGYLLDPDQSINDNVVAYLKYVHDIGAIVLLSRMSRMGSFFTRNGLSEPICLVRHPLHAYISFVGHRHPKAGDHLGGLDSEDRIRWYADQWNRMTDDYLNSGCKIIRFEFMQNDVREISNPGLPFLLRNWKTDKRNHNVLENEKADLLRELVADTYFRVYSDWGI